MFKPIDRKYIKLHTIMVLNEVDKAIFPVKNSIFYGIAWGVFIILLLNGKGFIKKVFELSILRNIGKISFGAYLVQSYFIFFIAPTYFKFPLMINNTLIIILTSLTAYVLHIIVENKFSKININKFSIKTRKQSVKE